MKIFIPKLSIHHVKMCHYMQNNHHQKRRNKSWLHSQLSHFYHYFFFFVAKYFLHLLPFYPLRIL